MSAGVSSSTWKTGGAEVTPSGWVPGKNVLKPGPDLVGRAWEVWSPADE